MLHKVRPFSLPSDSRAMINARNLSQASEAWSTPAPYARWLGVRADCRGESWGYAEKTGELLEDGQLVADGYSGGNDGKNNSDMQAVHSVGPIPQGGGSIEGPPINTAKTWALHTALEPRLSAPTRADGSVSSSRATQRSLQDALLRHVQSENRLSNSGDTELEVVAEFQTQDVQQDKTA
jgi:hypothetical protein